MQTPSSSGQPGLSPGFWLSSRPLNYTPTTEHLPNVLASSLEANTRHAHHRTRILNLPSDGLPSLSNSYSPNISFFGGSQGDLVRAPVQQEIDNAPLIQSESGTQRPPKPQGNLLIHVKVVHTPETQMRILRLSRREQAIVLTDGGNTVESQLRVLDTIEQYPPDINNKRVWAEVTILSPSGKETLEYRCKAPDCDYRDQKFQKARQHFVSCHVAEPCWGCPIEGCTHIGKYKRLDDLKHHHMVPAHRVEYTRNKKREASECPANSSTAGQAASHPISLASPCPDGQADMVATLPTLPHNLGPTSLHTSSQVERGSKKARQARLEVSAGPSQVGRNRLGRAVIASRPTSGQGRDMPVGTEASPSNMFYQDTTQLGVATPANVYTNALSPQSYPQQRSPWSNHSSSPAYVGTSLSENPYSPDALGLTYCRTSHSPLDPLLDSTPAYVPQRSAYGELPMSSAPQQGSHGNAAMPYASSPLRGHPDPHGMASAHRPLTVSPQEDVGFSVPLRGQVTDGAYLSRQDRSNSQINRVPDDLSFGGGLNRSSPGTRPLVPSPHYNQWDQTGAGLPTNYPYNIPHQLSSSTNMPPTTSSSAYLVPSYSPSRTSGALSSGRSNSRDSALSSVPYAPPQRVAGPAPGFAENGRYLSAQTFSGPHSMGVTSPTHSTTYQDRLGRQIPHESTMMYQAHGFDDFETLNPNFDWSPLSEYPQTGLSINLQSNVSPNSCTSSWPSNPSNF